uniref:Protein kinase domain-containing protein n=1 Tax=Globisporangium ultimum (strain ATCC 200006 / CBS 805.95 / DAOM BR144) TaxID=431595 RepID=K3X9F6_GLOUD
MHGQNIVHNDLRCDDILVGMDGKAKLIDFGAIVNEAEIQVDLKHMGAVPWKSLEYLAGERPSFVFDVYSFAMCILEALTKDISWGSNLGAASVRFQLKRGNIPKRPERISDKQWNLIELIRKVIHPRECR